MTANQENPTIEALIEAQFAADRREREGTDTEETFLGSINAFTASSPWLGPEHGPAIVTLRALARQLDQRVTAALVAQFGVTFRDLRSQSPSSTAPSSDPIETALALVGK